MVLKRVVFLAIVLNLIPLCYCKGQCKLPKNFVDDLPKIDQNYELRYGFVIYSHGARTPSKYELLLLKKDLITEKKFLPYGMGMQTTQGNRMIYEVGAFLNRRYRDFLGDDQSVAFEVDLRCTDFKYTKVSALVGMMGMLKPSMFNLEIRDISPVLYSYKKPEMDELLYYKNCPKYEELQGKAMTNTTTEIKKKLQKFCDELFVMISKYSVHNVTTLNDVVRFANLMRGLDNVNISYPDWFDEAFEAKLKKCVSVAYEAEYSSQNLTMLSAGQTLERLHKTLELIITNISALNEKLHIIAGHPKNVAAMIAALGVELFPHEDFEPRYGSVLALDVVYYNNYKDYGVKAFYLSDPTCGTNPIELKLKACAHLSYCKIKLFLKATKRFVQSEIEYLRVCRNSLGKKKKYHHIRNKNVTCKGP